MNSKNIKFYRPISAMIRNIFTYKKLFIFFLFCQFFIVPNVFASDINLVQQAIFSQNYVAPASATTVVSVTLSTSASAGNILLTAVSTDKVGGAFTAPDGFTLVESYNSPTSGVSTEIGISAAFAYKVAVGGETSITWSHVNKGVSTAWIAEYSGMNPLSLLGVSTSSNSGKLNVLEQTTGTTTITSEDDDLAIAIFAVDSWDDSPNRIWANGFTELAFGIPGNVANGPPGLAIATKVLTQAEEQTTTVNWSSGGKTDQSYAAIFTFKGTTGVSGSLPTLTITSPTSITATSSILNASIVDDGGASTTVRGFNYGLTTSYGLSTSTSGTYGTGAYLQTITGLTCNTTYHVQAYSTNSAGTGTSTDETFVTGACSAPEAPTSVTAIPGNTQASVTFVAPVSNGGSAITGYTVTSNPAGGVDTNAGSTTLTHIVTGLSNGTAYTFTVTATNIAGTSSASTASSPVTPAASAGITLVQGVTGVTATAATTVTCTLSSVTPGNLIVTTVASDKAAGTYNVPAGFTMVQYGSGVVATSSGTVSGAMAYKISAGGETTVTWTQTNTATAGMTCWAAEYSGLALSDVLDVSAENETQLLATATSSSISSGTTGITSVADELAIFLVTCDTIINCDGGGTRDYTNGFTEIAFKAATSSGGVGQAVASKVLSSTGAVETTYSFTDTGDQMYAMVATFKASNNSPASLPTLTITSPTSITATSSILNASIVDDGGASTTVRGFNYGLTTSYGLSTSTSGTYGTGAYLQTITGLTCNTTYHVQAYSTNSAGTGTSTDETFLTSECPESSTSVVPDSLVLGSSGSTTVSFTTTGTIPADGIISVTFPLGFTFNSGGFTTVTSSNISGTLSISPFSTSTLLVRRSGGSPVSGALSLVISNIRNPITIGTTGVFGVQTFTSSFVSIDLYSNVNPVSITTAPIGTLLTHSVSPSSLVSGVTGDVTLSFDASNFIPANGKIVLKLPSGFSLNSTGSSTATVLSGLGGLLTTTASGTDTLILSRPSAIQHVIEISMDGLGASLNYLPKQISDGLAPHFKFIQDNGVYTNNARTDDDVAVTSPSHTGILTGRAMYGVGGSGNQVFGHSWSMNGWPDGAINTIAEKHGSYVPSVYDVVHDNGLRTGLYVTKDKLATTAGSGEFGVSWNATNGAEDFTGVDNGKNKIDSIYEANYNSTDVLNKFKTDMAANPFNYALVHFSDPDQIGHASGWGSTAYQNSITTIDGYVGQILDLIENTPSLNGNTAIIITADHGGHSTTHGVTTDPLDYTIPFYVWGPSNAVASGTELYSLNTLSRLDPTTGHPNYSITTVSQPIRNADGANFALSLLGLPSIITSTANADQSLRVVSTSTVVISISNIKNPTDSGPTGTFEIKTQDIDGNIIDQDLSVPAVTLSDSATIPDAPTEVTAIAGDTTASISFTAPASDGGSSILYYTITSNPESISTTTTSTSSIIMGLTNNTAYTFTVTATNDIGTSSNSVASNSVTPVLVDITAPIISVIASSTGITSATIIWTTNENSTSTVNYGTTVGYGSASTSDTSTTSHSIVISDLTADTTYHFQVASADAAGNVATSSDYTFRTTVIPDTTAPIISVIASSTGITSATITWTTNENSTSTVNYGTTVGYGSASTSDTSTTSHSIVISDLTADTTYHFQVASADAAGNVATSSDYMFTTGFVISNVSIGNINSNSVDISWMTNELANSRVEYGPTTEYGSLTNIEDFSGVTSHSVSLSNLISCASYHYRVISSDLFTDSATSSDSLFFTPGCTGNSAVSTSTASSASTISSSTIILSTSVNDSITLDIPASYTSTTSSAIFQLKQLDGVEFFLVASTPTNLTAVGNYVYNLKALIDATTTLSTFDQPITVTLSYNLSELGNVSESTLVIYRYDGSSWYPLSNCSVNTSVHTVSCTTSSFSDFGIFGQISETIRRSHRSNVVSIPVKTPVIATSSDYYFSRDLTIGSVGEDVLQLQKLLNKQGFIISTFGPGSFGNESTYFGLLTQEALKRFQQSKGITPVSGYFGPKTRETLNNNQKINISTITQIYLFTRDLEIGSVGEDVLQLQKLLNKQGFIISTFGPGSFGNESTYFGLLTQEALKRFQQSKGITPVSGYFGPKTRAIIMSI